MRATTIIWTIGLLIAVFSGGNTAAAELPKGITDDPLLNSRYLLFGSDRLRIRTWRWAVQRGNTDMVAPIIFSLRYLDPEEREAAAEVLRKLTGQRFGDNWIRWTQWQQTRPDIVPFEGYSTFLAGILKSLDEKFIDLIYPGIKHSIRLEEILWGGARAKTGIPALNNPTMIAGPSADYLKNNEPVFGVAINGDVRAYPYRFMDWHEMLNDTIGGVPVALAYCTLCGSGILFSTEVEGFAEPIIFGSSGLLYRSNKLMFDDKTESLWNQFTGEPAVGKLTNSGIKLKPLPLVTTTWGDWQKRHPDTQVLSPDTGFERDYRPGKPYGKYFKSSKLLFPAALKKDGRKPKSEVFALRLGHSSKSWPLKEFAGGAVINDRAGVVNLVLVGDEKSREIRAYRRAEEKFEKVEKSDRALTQLRSNQGLWSVTEEALIGPNGEALSRLPGHIAYWFAWQTYFDGASE